MPKGPIRRSQMIAPFGTGAMVVVKDGASVIACGFDYWFEPGDETDSIIDLDDYKIEEWRLQKQLKVSHFRQPPDYRNRRDNKDKTEKPTNFKITVPFLRFPQWHFCQDAGCRRLAEIPLHAPYRPECLACKERGKKRYLVQVPFVSICDNGHIQDFPWREWVHYSATPNCQSPLKLVTTGGASLAAQKIVCDCGKSRTLASITEGGNNDSFLTNNLDNNREKFFCPGLMPWLGQEAQEPCDRPLRGSLRNASNVYYSQIKSAIYLPRGSAAVSSELIEMMEVPPLSTLINMAKVFNQTPTADIFRNQYESIVSSYTNEQIEGAVKILLDGEDETRDFLIDGDDVETSFRREEYEVLKTTRKEIQLQIKETDISSYEPCIENYFSRIMLVDKLRETRAFTGFSRIVPENENDLKRRASMLWKKPPAEQEFWLPAYIVYGEGLFLEFNEEKLRKWEQNKDIILRAGSLNNHYQDVQLAKGYKSQSISARYLLIHTFSHLLINRLTFECGYSTASLKERLYISSNPNAPMSGVLIYTAAGDSEGTMGGLVRMGQKGYLEPVIRRALEGALWCSSDPICMETGNRGGQGSDSCNLAACHSCCLVPETACDNFNRFLDRTVVVGDLSNSCRPFFDVSTF